ncbi:hypothetical protein ONE63_008768 [Megalurothrips usitatus]|uniref:Uncharacterized protein n=1 Tax=Megalurothrips usitatus TaxID=439358 RepID=A0AAV7XS25_9NEOP|nr:hypothetical protein ONE63_008768 [Megalurothrips usitatus]
MMTGLMPRGGVGVMMSGGGGLCAPESSPEVTSSSSPLGSLGGLGSLGTLNVVASTSHGLGGLGLHHHHHGGLGGGGGAAGSGGVISPSHSLGSSDIGDVDLELWDLDLHGNPQPRQNLMMHHRLHAVPQGNASFGTSHCSDTSESISGKEADRRRPRHTCESLSALTYLTPTATYYGSHALSLCVITPRFYLWRGAAGPGPQRGLSRHELGPRRGAPPGPGSVPS